MSFSPLLSRFIEQSPIPVMAQALLERVLSSEWLDGYFARTADKQYTRDLLFSSLFAYFFILTLVGSAFSYFNQPIDWVQSFNQVIFPFYLLHQIVILRSCE